MCARWLYQSTSTTHSFASAGSRPVWLAANTTCTEVLDSLVAVHRDLPKGTLTVIALSDLTDSAELESKLTLCGLGAIRWSQIDLEVRCLYTSSCHSLHAFHKPDAQTLASSDLTCLHNLRPERCRAQSCCIGHQHLEVCCCCPAHGPCPLVSQQSSLLNGNTGFGVAHSKSTSVQLSKQCAWSPLLCVWKQRHVSIIASNAHA